MTQTMKISTDEFDHLMQTIAGGWNEGQPRKSDDDLLLVLHIIGEGT